MAYKKITKKINKPHSEEPYVTFYINKTVPCGYIRFNSIVKNKYYVYLRADIFMDEENKIIKIVPNNDGEYKFSQLNSQLILSCYALMKKMNINNKFKAKFNEDNSLEICYGNIH